jgi:signal transduction histidine kinase
MTFELMELKVAERTAELEQVNRELLSANMRLRQLDHLKSKFVSDVSHELRTPITNLGVYIYLLENSASEQHQERLDVLKDQVRRLRILVEDILSLSRLEAEKGSIKFQPVNLNHIVSATITSTLPRGEDNQVQLTFEPDHQLPTVDAEPTQMHQVAVNLIVNALNYTSAGYVKVSTGHDTDRQQIWLRVEDSGMGIDAEDREHIFDRFYRGKRASQSDIPGTGLGLGIVKEIVDIHRGRIDLNTEVNKGTTFTVYLPYRQPRH